MFNNLIPNIRLDTYLTCLSEHRVEEDLCGRLSMWRAYGGSTGVAIVINGGVLHATTDVLGAYSSPVFYGNQAEFEKEFLRVVTGIAAEVSFLCTLNREMVKNAVFHMFRFATLCTKHPGFREELEWRIAASPTLYSPPRLENGIEVVRGVPQRVLKIKLENSPAEGLTGLALPELLDRIIIGPCKFPGVTAMAFHQCLQEAGITDPAKHIKVSDIPLRHNE